MNVPIPRIVCLLSLIGTFAFSAPSEKRIYPAFSYGADHDFGAAVAIDGDHAVVGAPGDGEGGLNAGAAFLFDVASGNQIRKLTASDAAVGDELGDAVAIGGNYIAFGASNKNGDEGAVYVFDRNTGGELHKLVAFGVGDDPMDYADTSFGISLAISGNYLIVGAEGDDISAGNAGAAYIFDLASGNEIHRLDPDDPEASALFGCSVDISGNYALVGSEKATGTSNSGSGAAYLFDVTTGDQIRKLAAADPSEDAMFGAAVAISGTLAVVGAPFDDEGGSDSGAAYVFDVVSGNRTRKLIGPVAESNFGRSLSMSDTHVLVGAPAELVQATFAAGAGYLMNATDGALLHRLTASDRSVLDTFGWSVGLSGNAAVVGAIFKNALEGAAYVYTGLGGPDPSNAVAKAKLKRKIAKLSKAAKRAKRAGNVRKARAIQKKLRELKQKLRRL
jgi:hypothetical protein